MPSRFKLDENLPRDAEAFLRAAGHDTHTVPDEDLGGSADAKVFAAARAENRILVTLDLDFADIRLYPPASHCGIWVLRAQTQNLENVLALLRGALAVVKMEPTNCRLWIVEADRIRIRA